MSGDAGPVLTVRAPAKLNLYLEVLGRRSDGFHELVTVLTTLDLADSLALALVERRDDLPPDAADVRLTLTGDHQLGDSVPTDRRNLVVAAAELWLAAAGLTHELAVAITLDKRIPAGGGLGGGSSDAAATLRGLQQLTGEPLDAGRVRALAAQLGSDVPFFLVGGTALATGRGEQVRPIAPPAETAVELLIPGFGVSTPAVYGALAAGSPGDPQRPLSFWDTALEGADAITLEALYRNDLETPARTVEPRLARLLAVRGHHLSGSGSTLFAFSGGGPGLTTSDSDRVVRARCGLR